MSENEKIKKEMREPENMDDMKKEYITKKEVLDAMKKLKSNKAPGLNGIPPSLVKWMIERDTTKITRMVNAFIKEGRFPESFKSQRLVLIKKEGRDPGCDNAYRPLYIIDA